MTLIIIRLRIAIAPVYEIFRITALSVFSSQKERLVAMDIGMGFRGKRKMTRLKVRVIL
jgi:hypothetical protein